jgi:hypothetical protein
VTRHWVIRTDKAKTKYIWSELEAGRLRQGWGYRADQDLNLLRSLRERSEPMSSDQQASWRGNRRLSDSEPDGVRVGDFVLVPHVPQHGMWSLAQVNGPYRFVDPTEENSDGFADYGHVLPVELLNSKERPISPYEEGVAASLRQTMGVRSRMWNVDALGPEIEALVQLLKSGEPPAVAASNRLPKVLDAAQAAAWDEIHRQYHGAEFERPCVLLLEALYGEGNVEHTGGSGERGADAICTFNDPLGIPHRLAVQIKMWSWDAGWTRPLEQIKQAYGAYEGITGGIILSTSEGVTHEFEERRLELEAELRIPIRVILRDELVQLFVANLPRLASLE